MFFLLCVNQCEEENEIMLAHLGNWDSSALECGNCGFPVVARNQVKSCTMHCTTTQPHNAVHNHTTTQYTTPLCRTVEGVVVDCPSLKLHNDFWPNYTPQCNCASQYTKQKTRPHFSPSTSDYHTSFPPKAQLKNSQSSDRTGSHLSLASLWRSWHWPSYTKQYPSKLQI